MAIVKTDVPMTSDLNYETIQKLAKTYPFFRTGTLVWTDFGRPVQILTGGTGSRHVLFSASHHANEWITTPLLLKFMEALGEAQARGGMVAGQDAGTLLKAVTIHTVPMVNPDGVDLVTGAIPEGSPQYDRARTMAERYPAVEFPTGWRANLNGVDLNLQYPAGWRQARRIKFQKGFTRPGPRDFVGRSPLNQRETFAMASFTEKIAPEVVVALHAQGQVIYWQFENYTVPGARALGEKMAEASGYTLADTPFASSFAGYKDWFIQAYGRPGYTVEVGLGENPLPLSQFDAIYEAVEPLLVRAAVGS